MTLEERIENARSDFQHSPRQPTLLTALKTKHADPFSEATRQLALQADIINNQAEKIARLEEVAEPRKEWRLEFTIGTAPHMDAIAGVIADLASRA